LLQNHQFEPTPSIFGAPIAGDPIEVLLRFFAANTRVSGVVCVILHLAVLVQCRLVTDRWTDTRWQHIPC